MNPSQVTPSDVFSWIRRHFRNRILFHFITTDKVALTSLRVPGKTLVQSAIQEGSTWVTAGSAGLAPGWPPLAAASASSMVMHGISARIAQKRTRGPEGSPDLPEVTQLAGGGAGIRTWYIPLPLSMKFGITPPLLFFKKKNS